MLFDMRIYTCKPGTVPAQLELYKQYGYAPQTRHLGQPVLYGVTETGPINTCVHVWADESAGDREQQRTAMPADPEWQTFLQKSKEAGNLVTQENRLLTSVAFG